VNVALAVGAPVMVAALGNGNNIVKVFDAVRRSRIDELREHGHDALEQVDAALVQLALDQLIELHDIELRPRLRALITATASFPLPSAATPTRAITSTATEWPRRF
jgi:hypothetical protein